MIIDIITIFGDALRPYFNESILKIAREKATKKSGYITCADYTLDKHKKGLMTAPFGGGCGMVLPASLFLRR